ncbi:EF-hand domain-containing protein [Neorhodopirellula lusitana]|uniref:EF-hand domain-containing protein n=1 Tax=Neorhodopirellula lusitana TaxID=445327 RepID=UPI00384C9A5B
MKRIFLFLASVALVVPSIGGTVHADDDNQNAVTPKPGWEAGEGRRGEGMRRERFRGDAMRGRDGENRRSDGAASGAALNLDPAKIAERMMQSFDKDGDQKLDQTELTAMLTSLRERRGGREGGAGLGNARDGAAQRQPGRMQRGQGDAQRGNREFKSRRPKGDTEGAQPGGEVPQRPDEV